MKYCCDSFQEAHLMGVFHFELENQQWSTQGFYVDYCPFCGRNLAGEVEDWILWREGLSKDDDYLPPRQKDKKREKPPCDKEK